MTSKLIIGLVVGFVLGGGIAYFASSEIDNAVNEMVNTSETVDVSNEISLEHIGKSVISEGIKYTLLSVSKSKNSLSDGRVFGTADTTARDGAIFVIVTMEMENVSSDLKWIPTPYTSWTLTDDLNRHYWPSTSNIPVSNHPPEGYIFQMSIPPGLKNTGSIGYEVPDEESDYSMFIFGPIT